MSMKVFLLFAFAFGACSGMWVRVDSSAAPDLKDYGEKAAKTVRDWYDGAARYFNSSTYEHPPRIQITIKQIDPPAQAYRSNRVGYIEASINHARKYPEDLGMYIHESVHIITQARDCPGWIVEGLADYVRYWKYEKKKIEKPRRDQSYKQGYGIAGYLMNYVSKAYNKPKLDIVLNTACRDGKYNDGIWIKETKKSVDDLWEEMQQKG